MFPSAFFFLDRRLSLTSSQPHTRARGVQLLSEVLHECYGNLTEREGMCLFCNFVECSCSLFSCFLDIQIRVFSNVISKHIVIKFLT